ARLGQNQVHRYDRHGVLAPHPLFCPAAPLILPQALSAMPDGCVWRDRPRQLPRTGEHAAAPVARTCLVRWVTTFGHGVTSSLPPQAPRPCRRATRWAGRNGGWRSTFGVPPAGAGRRREPWGRGGG